MDIAGAFNGPGLLLQGLCRRWWACASGQHCLALSAQLLSTDPFSAAAPGALPTLVRVSSRSEQQVRLASLTVLRELARQDALQTALVAEGAVALLAALQHSAAPEVRLPCCDWCAALVTWQCLPCWGLGALLAALQHSAVLRYAFHCGISNVVRGLLHYSPLCRALLCTKWGPCVMSPIVCPRVEAPCRCHLWLSICCGRHSHHGQPGWLLYGDTQSNLLLHR